MRSFAKFPLLVAASLALTACAIAPSGPSVTALPGSNRAYDQFRNDDWTCRQEANRQANGATQSANGVAIGHAAVGTLIGALMGAAIGGARAVAIGAGTGLIFGSANGAAAQGGNYGSQRQYDAAYVQCMYAAGHRVPVSGQLAPAYSVPPPPAPLPSANNPPPPPPPPGSPPPPPPSLR